jgi:hypothetical protein
VSGSPRDDGWFSVTQAARLWNVTRQTANEYFRDGRVTSVRRGERRLEAPERAVWAAKVLLPSDLEAKFKVTTERLAAAEREGLVRAHRGRFSLDDLAVLREGHRARQTAAPNTRMTPEQRAEELERMARGGGRPADYSDAFWDTEVCPTFSPPVSVFAFGLGAKVPDDGRPMARWITRSAGWEKRNNGDVVWVEATDQHVLRTPAIRRLPEDLAKATQLYRLYEAAWRDEWMRRRRGDQKTTKS